MVDTVSNDIFIFYFYRMAKAQQTSEEGNELQWYQRHATDTGSPEYQINALSVRISSLQ